MLRALGICWSFPFTLLGLILCAVARATGSARPASWVDWTIRVAFPKGTWAWEFYKRMDLDPFDGKLGYGASGTTLGIVIFGRQEAFDRPEFMKHELHHVHQFMAMGPFILIPWLLGGLCAGLCGLHVYRQNPIELAARKAAGQPL